jgi:hypothetical protein
MYLALQVVLEQLKELAKDTGIILEEVEREIITSQDKRNMNSKWIYALAKNCLERISAKQEELK